MPGIGNMGAQQAAPTFDWRNMPMQDLHPRGNGPVSLSGAMTGPPMMAAPNGMQIPMGPIAQMHGIMPTQWGWGRPGEQQGYYATGAGNTPPPVIGPGYQDPYAGMSPREVGKAMRADMKQRRKTATHFGKHYSGGKMPMGGKGLW